MYFLQFDCNLAPLTNYGEWYDHQGTSKSYFSGENGEKICECGLSNDCENSLNGDVNLCNCDANLPLDKHDSGTITKMVKIDLSSFWYVVVIVN